MTNAVAVVLPLEPGSARRAREQLEPFRKSLDEMSFFDLRLLVSELVVEALIVVEGLVGGGGAHFGRGRSSAGLRAKKFTRRHRQLTRTSSSLNSRTPMTP